MEKFPRAFFAAAAVFAGTAALLRADAVDDVSAAGTGFGEVYTAARAALRRDGNLITPFYAYYAQRLPASISGGGRMAASVYGTGCSWRFVHPEKTRIALSDIDYRRTDYRFSGGRAAPFEHTDSIFASTYQEFIDPETGRALVGMAAGVLAAEDGASLSDGFGGVVALGGKQYFSERTSATLGVSALYRFDRERWFFYPFASFDVSITPTLNLRLLNGVSLTWDVFADNSFLLDFSVRYRTSMFAVAPEAGRSRAYYEQSVPVGVAGTWNLTDSFYVGAGVVLNTWAKYRLYRGGRETDEDFTSDPSIEFSLQAGVRF